MLTLNKTYLILSYIPDIDSKFNGKQCHMCIIYITLS